MNPIVFPLKRAEFAKEFAGRPYRPSNHTEGEFFFDAWCRRCMRDKAMRTGCDIDECDDNERCEIITHSMMYKTEDPEYPKEWQIDVDGQPCCRAFTVDDKVPDRRCTNTIDLFSEVQP